MSRFRPLILQNSKFLILPTIKDTADHHAMMLPTLKDAADHIRNFFFQGSPLQRAQTLEFPMEA